VNKQLITPPGDSSRQAGDWKAKKNSPLVGNVVVD
jgi:hypothetical protein